MSPSTKDSQATDSTASTITKEAAQDSVSKLSQGSLHRACRWTAVVKGLCQGALKAVRLKKVLVSGAQVVKYDESTGEIAVSVKTSCMPDSSSTVRKQCRCRSEAVDIWSFGQITADNS